MLHSLNRKTVSVFLAVSVAACSNVAAYGATSTEVPQEAPATEGSVDWNDLLLRMQEADRIDDDVARCRSYPNVPGLTWPLPVVTARCALQRKPRYDMEMIAKEVETGPGRLALDRHFHNLLNAHYVEPAERDQIAQAFEIFDEQLEARTVAERWYTLSPNSAYARLALGLTLLKTSLSARGADAAPETPSNDLSRTGTLAQQADQMLVLAQAAEPRLTPACVGRVTAARVGGHSEDPFVLGRRCVEQDPLSYMAVIAWKVVAEPRWGGSDAQLREVARHALLHRQANPLMESVRAAIQEDARLNREPQESDLEPLIEAARVGPNSLVLNQLSAAWFARGDGQRGMAYLSQAVRFNVGVSGYRMFRVHTNLVTRPEWAIIDLQHALKSDSDSLFLRELLAQATENLRVSTAERMARDGYVTLEGASVLNLQKATILKECEDYGLAGKTSSDVMDRCIDELVREWPEEAEAWRVRADVMYLRGDPLALDAARRYLEIADPEAPGYGAHAARYSRWLKAQAEP